MSDPSTRREGLGLLGLGAAACVACCAGPILAFLGGLTIAGLASTVLFGVAGLAVAVGAGAGWWAIWRRCGACAPPADQPVAVAAPATKASR